LPLAACATPDMTSRSFPAQQAGQVSRVEPGVIVNVRSVTIEGGRTTFGPVVGAALGGVAGSMVGGGTQENILGAIAGATLGGLGGRAIQRAGARQQGWAYVVSKLDGELVSIVQADDPPMAPGQAVFVEYSADRVRIIPR
jgi:outer membrane lipoprotein SlyB